MKEFQYTFTSFDEEAHSVLVSQQKGLNLPAEVWQHIRPKYIPYIYMYEYICMYIYIYLYAIYFQNYKYNDFYYKVFEYLHNNISLTPLWQVCG